ncbi:c-type cytochrome biogenesis protein CcmI [Sinimarinibacterium thermocellulolyticum]|uniref:C-type cytochrome biogenesis protein CcmI n=1 Tax=Sinimarinibacterium thermocellulolyticum TaxID=3170016 RepID=A0ABV2A870_9GAMM
MIGVWMAAIVLIAVGLALWPLWAGRPGLGPRRRTLNVAGYRGRLTEIDAELAAGTITAEAAQALREEAAARLLADAEEAAEPRHDAGSDARAWGLFAAAALLIVLVSGLGYWFGDSRELAQWIEQSRRDPAGAQRLSIESMVARMERRLEDEPQDAEGWAMLGRSYFVIGRHEDAAVAFDRANRLTAAAPRADWLASEAEVHVMLQGHDFRGLPRQLFERALAIEPGHPKALWYAGLAAAQAGEFALAVERWQALREGELPDEFRAVLDERLQELAQLAAKPAPVASAAASADPAPEPRLVLEIELADELANSVGASDVLFVIARRPDAPGPPLAVRRLSAGMLPTRVVLDDSHAMAPGMKLSLADEWEVVARISRDGTPQAKSGDFEGRLRLGRGDAGKPVALRIDRRLP